MSKVTYQHTKSHRRTAMIPITDIDKVSLKCHRRRIRMECEAFFAVPENRKRFEEWKESRDAKQKSERVESVN